MKNIFVLFSILFLFESCEESRRSIMEVLPTGKLFYSEGKPYSGIVFEMYDENRLRYEFHVKEGYLNGDYVNYDENSRVSSLKKFEKGFIYESSYFSYSKVLSYIEKIVFEKDTNSYNINNPDNYPSVQKYRVQLNGALDTIFYGDMNGFRTFFGRSFVNTSGDIVKYTNPNFDRLTWSSKIINQYKSIGYYPLIVKSNINITEPNRLNKLDGTLFFYSEQKSFIDSIIIKGGVIVKKPTSKDIEKLCNFFFNYYGKGNRIIESYTFMYSSHGERYGNDLW